jgi:hypothetical protein
MKGFVKNEGNRGSFILKRAINPGFSITFEEAYVVVGKKSGKKRGPTFVNWLRENVFKNDKWGFYKEEGVAYFDEPLQEAVSSSTSEGFARGAGKPQIRSPEDPHKVGITAEDIINNEIVIAKGLIDKCGDKSVLKKALAATKIRSKKEAHMRYLIARIQQI